MNNLGFHCHGLDHLEEAIVSNGLRRGEFFNFPPQELGGLKKAISQYGLAMSIHAPLVRIPWYPDPPTWSFLCDVDGEKMRLTLRMVRETLEMAREFGAEYVVAHFPSPCSTDVTAVGYDELRQTALEGATGLAELSQEYDIPIHLEGFGPSPFLKTDFLAEVISEFPSLSYCFDTGHMNIAAKRDGFDLYEFARQIAPYTGSIHLWNNRGERDYIAFRHIAVHPSQRPEDGWADIARILKAMMPSDPSRPIIFESGLWYPRELGDYDFRDGVRWIKGLVATFS